MLKEEIEGLSMAVLAVTLQNALNAQPRPCQAGCSNQTPPALWKKGVENVL